MKLKNIFVYILLAVSVFIVFSCAVNSGSTNNSGFIREKDLTVSKLVSDALNSMRESKPQVAVNLLEEADEREPGSKVIRENLAQAYLQANYLDKSKVIYLELQSGDPASSTYPLALGDIEFTNLNYLAAKELYLLAKKNQEVQPIKDVQRENLIQERINDTESKLNPVNTPTFTPTPE